MTFPTPAQASAPRPSLRFFLRASAQRMQFFLTVSAEFDGDIS